MGQGNMETSLDVWELETSTGKHKKVEHEKEKVPTTLVSV
jgi:hypothetical protein